MKSAAEPRSVAPRADTRRQSRWALPVAVLLVVFVFAWTAQGPVLRTFARAAFPAAARAAGYELEFDVLSAGFFVPMVLGNVHLRDAAGSDVRAARVELAFASAAVLVRDPLRLVRRLTIHELSGGLRLGESAGASRAAIASRPAARTMKIGWPTVVEIGATKFFLSQGDRHLLFKDAELFLSEESVGRLRIGEAGLWIGSWSKTFPALQGVTAWRDGAAYFSDLALARDAVIDSLAVDMEGIPAVTLRGRAFGGSIYADWTGGVPATAALNAYDISLDAFGKFLALEAPLHGRLGTLKFTFSGDPRAPLEAQSSLRAEAADFSWAKRAFSGLRLGASLSGGHLKIDELLLEQKANRVSARGSLLLPAGDWRAADVALKIEAIAKDARALTEVFGRPWNKLSGGFTLEGDVAGRLGEPSGWLKARGWDLRVPGVPASSLQADITMNGGTIKIAALESHSGPNFLRADGEVSLREPLSYRGRLEARVREVSHYLEPLGRFAPDWAQQGGVICFWDGDGTGANHSGVVSLELFDFTGEMNPVPVNGKLAATYSPGNVYVSRFFLDRGPLSLSASCYLSGKGLSVQDIQLFNLRQRLLRAELFLPVSWPLLLEGKTWSDTMLPGAQIYANVRSDDLRLGPLANLFGQSAPFEGRVDWKLDATGPWDNPSGQSTMTIDGFRTAFDNFAIPSSRVEAKATLAQQRLDAAGRLAAGETDPIKLTASIPLLGRNDNGGFRVLDRSKPAAFQVEVPPLDLRKFAGVRPLAGQFVGSVKISGRLSAPQFEGALQWDKVTFVPVEGLAPLTDFAGRFVFAGSEAKFDGAKGKMGEGTFILEGRSNLADPLNIATTAKFSGKKLQLVDTEKFRFAADADLVIEDAGAKRSVSGNINLVDGTARISLSATPLLMPSGTTSKALTLDAPFKVGGWLGNSDAAISIRTVQPVQLTGGTTAAVDVALTGPLRAALPAGIVEFQGLQAALPSAPLVLSRAKFSFVPALPWVPILDLWGSVQVGGYQVAATAWGPLGQQHLKLESVPESYPQDIALLLGAGIDPENEASKTEIKTDMAEKSEQLPPPQIGYSWHVE